MQPSRAHSPVLQARLAISLAWVAGYTNTIAVLVCGHVASHVTGHAGQLGQATAEGDWRLVIFVAAVLAAFFLGAVLSACATEFARWRGLRSIYIAPAAIEILLLVVFANLVRIHDPAQVESGAMRWWMAIVASVAMGLQNATITRISGGVVRTTHLTGVLTDLGLESVQQATRRLARGSGAEGRGMDVDTDSTETQSPGQPPAHARPGPRWRLSLLASIFAAFVFGSGCAALGFAHAAHWSMVPPVLLLGWILIADLRTPIAEIDARRFERW